MHPSIPVADDQLHGLTAGQVLQIRNHLAQKYYWRFGYRVPFDVLRDAGQHAIVATITDIPPPPDAGTLATLLYRQVKGAMLQAWQQENQQEKRRTCLD